MMRISGLTVDPDGDDLRLALSRLEGLMAELFEKNINVNYYFESSPDLATPHNVKRAFWYPIACLLAFRLCPDFGKQPPEVLLAMRKSGYSTLSSATAVVDETNYPSRMPRGSGNRFYQRTSRFFPEVEEAPVSAKTVQMYIDEVNTFVENYNAFLREGETVSAATITSDTGLTISGETVSSPNVTYTVTAAGSSDSVVEEVLQVKIVMTTSDSRILTRIINFKLKSSDIS